MFIHTGNHTLVYQPFPVARLQQSITKHKTSSSTHTKKKKVLPKAEANVSKKKKNQDTRCQDLGKSGPLSLS